MDKEEALAVAAEFDKFLKTGDDAIIKKYSKEYIGQAISFIPLFNVRVRKPWYKEMERRRDYLEKLVEEKRKNKWCHGPLFIGIVSAIIAALIGAFLTVYFIRLFDKI